MVNDGLSMLDLAIKAGARAYKVSRESGAIQSLNWLKSSKTPREAGTLIL